MWFGLGDLRARAAMRLGYSLLTQHNKIIVHDMLYKVRNTGY